MIINGVVHIVFVLGLFTGSLLHSTLAHAELVKVSSTMNPVGSGARAMGMGGAFIGIADDATAASWNPAGLVQLERAEFSAVYDFSVRKQDNSSLLHSEANGKNSMAANGVNYASTAYPFIMFGHNLTASINYQSLFEMNKSISLAYTYRNESEELNGFNQFTEKGNLYALSPALAVRICPSFALGMTFNYWDDLAGKNGWQTTEKFTLQTNRYLFQENWENRFSLTGLNFNVGMLWTFHESISLGAVYKTAFDATRTQESIGHVVTKWPTLGEQFTSTKHTIEEQTLSMPASYGFGLACRKSDRLSFSFDVYRTEWSKFILRDSFGVTTNPIDDTSATDLDNTTQYRLGAEYLIIRGAYVIPLRFGLFSDPQPKHDGVVNQYGVSIGSGFMQDLLALDIAYQYRQGDNDSSDYSSFKDIQVDVNQQMLMMSLIYYF